MFEKHIDNLGNNLEHYGNIFDIKRIYYINGSVNTAKVPYKLFRWHLRYGVTIGRDTTASNFKRFLLIVKKVITNKITERSRSPE